MVPRVPGGESSFEGKVLMLKCDIAAHNNGDDNSHNSI